MKIAVETQKSEYIKDFEPQWSQILAYSNIPNMLH